MTPTVTVQKTGGEEMLAVVCPFCGGDRLKLGTSVRNGTFSSRVGCRPCGIFGPSRSDAQRPLAEVAGVVAWNLRAPEFPLEQSGSTRTQEPTKEDSHG